MFQTYITDYGNTNCMLVPAADGAIRLIGGNVRRISRDNGRTWQDDNPRLPQADRSNTAMRMPDGRLLMVVWDPEPAIVKENHMNGTVFSLALSDDEGATYAQRWPLSSDVGCYYVMNDRLLRLKGGRILLSICQHPADRFQAGVEHEGMVTTAYSDDEGKTWKFGQWLDGNYQEPMTIEKADGTLMMFMRSHRGYLSISRSVDGGEHWSEPELSNLPMPCSPFCIKKDPFSGYVFLVWDHSFPAAQIQYPRSPLRMAVSMDDGESFSVAETLESNPDQHYGYPSIYFAKDEIYVNYYVNDKGRTFKAADHRIKLKIFRRDELKVEKVIRSPLF